MILLAILWRNVKWRFHHPLTIIITLLQPMLWLILYSAIAGESMRQIGITNYTAFMLPGLMVLVSFGACSSGGIMNFLMKANGSFQRVWIAPVPRNAIVLGQILEAVLCAFLEVGILYAVSLFFSVKIASGFVGGIFICLIVFMTAFFMASLTYAISLHLPNEVVYETVMNAIVLPVFFLSTALFPADTLTGGLAAAVWLNPLTYVIDALRILMLQDTFDMERMRFVFLLLALMCCLSFSWALHRLKKETHQ